MSGKILFVIGGLFVGGAEKHFSHLAIDLKKKGWSPEFFVIFPGGEYEHALRKSNVQIHTPFFIRGIKNFFPAWMTKLACRIFSPISLAMLMASGKFQVTHFCLPNAYLLGGFVSLLTRTRPRIMSRRIVNNYLKQSWIRARAESFLHPYMDLISGNSESVIENLIDEGIPQQKLRLIYNGVAAYEDAEINDFKKLRRELSIPMDCFVVTIIANYHPRKRHIDLLQALKHVHSSLPNPWRCLCVGYDRGGADKLYLMTAKLGLADKVLWLGGRADVSIILGASDIGVLCSEEEGFSNALLEAMSAGLPMVVTKVGGNPEAVVHNKSGIIVPPNDPYALADGLMELAHDPILRHKIGDAARQRVCENFSNSKCVAAYEELYNELLQVDSQPV